MISRALVENRGSRGAEKIGDTVCRSLFPDTILILEDTLMAPLPVWRSILTVLSPYMVPNKKEEEKEEEKMENGKWKMVSSFSINQSTHE